MFEPEQVAHFDTFGFICLRQAFSTGEMREITRAAERVWQHAGDQSGRYFAELDERLTHLADDERIHEPISKLLGPGYVFVGSEGVISDYTKSQWHADRRYYRLDGEQWEQEWIDYPRIKVMMYLETLTKDTGCIRFILGSHRQQYHQALGLQEAKANENPFGVDEPDVPAYPVESEPGDVVLFNQYLWHGLHGGRKGRRFLAFKFAAKPSTAQHLKTLHLYSPNMFQPHQSFLNSESTRIRDMVKDLPDLGEQHARNAS